MARISACVRIIENGAEILYYCSDAALKSAVLKDILLADVIYHQTVSCNPTPKS